MNEREIVGRLTRLFSDRIGDDCAVLGREVVTTDMLVEDVDFTQAAPLRLVGRKSLAVNLSDVAAMGAIPVWAVVALALPPWVLPKLDDLLDGLAESARQHRIEIVGGDLSKSEKLVISVTASGRLESQPLLRSGAKPGDRVYVSRPLGGSAAGLALLQKGWTAEGEPPTDIGYAHREFARSAIRRHLDPEPESALGPALAGIAGVTSCIDVSDGLSTDLHRLCEASKCGAEIEIERIPLFPDLLASGPLLAGIRVRDAVLHGGEEFALLFTSTLREADLSSRLGRPVYRIGRMVAGDGVMLRENGKDTPLDARGWDHFG